VGNLLELDAVYGEFAWHFQTAGDIGRRHWPSSDFDDFGSMTGSIPSLANMV
jgi:hypothetical protein